ncbi:RNase P subunit p30 family protein [Salinarchaeum laminariae]|uniref:RNase P subunit p30 family protein n=1 Tax=Salinarchaeum laminariae TaxID=869888 RepID=UPI0020BDEB50|nr:RNase P subunit p30 family protein [Salinarchaeum laminariae]
MYEAVHAAPEGESTVSRLAITAREYGYDGIVVRNHGDQRAEFDAAAVAEETGVDVVNGVEISAEDPQQASGYLGNFRPDYTLLVVHGGTTELNRFAVEQEKVDVLAHPMAGDGDLNHVLANAAAEHGVRIEVNLRPVLRESGGTRVRAIKDLRKCWELIEDADAPFVVSADPRSHLQLRGVRELRALGEEIGLPGEAIESGLAEWGRLAERNREINSESFIEPGVELGPYDPES